MTGRAWLDPGSGALSCSSGPPACRSALGNRGHLGRRLLGAARVGRLLRPAALVRPVFALGASIVFAGSYAAGFAACAARVSMRTRIV